MSGYTPVFNTVFTGTLHGRWPDTGLWLCILAMSDKHGIVDCTPAYIASVTGLTVTDVEQCISRFMEPDQYSRTQAAEGRRLELVDAGRPWGWRIVNHGKYREKARLHAKDSIRTESGADAARKAVQRGVPRCPPVSPAVPLSNTNTNTDTDTNQEGRSASASLPRPPSKDRRSKAKVVIPDDFVLTDDLKAYAESRCPGVAVTSLFESFAGKARAKGWAYANWPQAWQEFCRNCAPGSGHWASGQYPRLGAEGRRWE